MFNSKDSDKELNLNSGYPCPVCRRGEISAMALMDAFACNFCRHIFTADLKRNSLQMADSSSPITWYWTGKGWRGANRNGAELTWGVAIGAIALILLPTSLITFSVYLFPPIPGTPLAWLPVFWIGLTFVCHFWFVASMVIQYYQFPVLAYFNATQRRLFQR